MGGPVAKVEPVGWERPSSGTLEHRELHSALGVSSCLHRGSGVLCWSLSLHSSSAQGFPEGSSGPRPRKFHPRAFSSLLSPSFSSYSMPAACQDVWSRAHSAHLLQSPHPASGLALPGTPPAQPPPCLCLCYVLCSPLLAEALWSAC